MVLIMNIIAVNQEKNTKNDLSFEPRMSIKMGRKRGVKLEVPNLRILQLMPQYGHAKVEGTVSEMLLTSYFIDSNVGKRVN